MATLEKTDIGSHSIGTVSKFVEYMGEIIPVGV